MSYSLPKIWAARIQKYWDKVLPTDYPKSSSSFNISFSAEDKPLVDQMEENLGTEDSILNSVIEDGYYPSNYFGTWDIEGEAGELTLLSPETVDLKGGSLIAMHLNGENWEQIEDAHMVDGYAWGTVESFSPIALFAVKKDAAIGTVDFFKGKVFAANGNPVKVYTDDEGKIKIKVLTSGKEFDVADEGIVNIIGGSIDGTDIDTTDVSVVGINNENINFYSGSMYFDASEDPKSVKVYNANLKIINSKVRGVSAGVGMVRTENNHISLKGTKSFFIASGQSTTTKGDANKDMDSLSLGGRQWTKNTKLEILDGSEVQWVYSGGNSGYTYTVNAELIIKSSKVTGGCVAGGSNGKSDNVFTTISDSDFLGSNGFSSVNRGIVGYAKTTISDSKFEHINIYTDLDPDATGRVDKVYLDINKGTYGTIILGKNDDKLATSADAVEAVKISRSAEYTISDADLAILGNKFIIK